MSELKERAEIYAAEKMNELMAKAIAQAYVDGYRNGYNDRDCQITKEDIDVHDLGLPSGTLWKNANEGGDSTLYTYDEAVSMFGEKLPTLEQLEELDNECTWTWTGHGYKVTGSNGNSIYLPAAGYRYCDGDVGYVGAYGYYWSSTPIDSENAQHLYFNSLVVYVVNLPRCTGQSVRLVQ